MIQVTTKNRQLNHHDLARIEGKMGRPLPEPYRVFLLAHNGGQPKPDILTIPEAHFEGADVQVFLGVDTEVESSDIFWNLDVHEGCVENHLLPIAHDSFGNMFTLVLAEEEYGHVYYFDRAVYPPEPYFLANDFNEFLGKLRDATPEELADAAAAILSNDEDS